ncbi:MAG: hypothetical protein L0210_02790 [Rhodospirillales bacterium]|nr:hypothetical protein [Rhodospirillales bacterium]
MPGIARQGLDAAGGTQLGGAQITVYANGALVVLLGDPVAGHGPAPHAAPVMATASATVHVGGIRLCRAGDLASCGHASAGSGDVLAG